MAEYKSDCIFCKIANKKIPVELEYEDSAIAAFNDKNPQAPVHILIVPKAHMPKISDIAQKDINLLGQMLEVAKGVAAKKKISDSGYRLIINCGRDGGQIVEHIHIHLLGGRPLGWPPG